MNREETCAEPIDISNGKRPLNIGNHNEKLPVKKQAVTRSHDQVVTIDDDENDIGEPVDDNDVMEVEVMTPPRNTAAAAAAIDLSSESPVAISHNTTNPNIIYPHARKDCGLHPYKDDPEKICNNCFCTVCDAPAKDCIHWNQHCQLQLISKDKKKASRHEHENNRDDVDIDVIDLIGIRQASNYLRQRNRRLLERRWQDAIDEIIMEEPPEERERSGQRDRYGERRREKPNSEMRITEVLAERLSCAVRISDGSMYGGNSSNAEDARKSRITQLNMDGDIGRLKLQRTFFVEGVKIGWPFPAILPPQRQMALHIIRALKRKLHVVIESPTGTGKSAAILCSVLGWQRYQAKMQNDANQSEAVPLSMFNHIDDMGEKKVVPKVIYCSRTHSQVAQMVASLKKTPYRPRMTILGSRDRLCINRDVVGKKGININTACQDRKRETDRRRKRLLRDQTHRYDDDNPHIPQDDLTQTADDAPAEIDENAVADTEGDATENTGQNQRRITRKRSVCTHYMNLTNSKNITRMQSRYVWNTQRISSCCAGGEVSKAGVHDIEDLVAFGKNPNLEKGIAVYKIDGVGSFGILLANREGGGCVVNSLRNGSLAAETRSLRPGDWIVAVNGEDTTKLNMDQMVGKIQSITKEPLILDVLRDNETGESDAMLDGGYSEDAACPYFISRALKAHADLIFAPYNYILDPSILRSMQLPLENTIVVLDEAHNVENTLRESGSCDVREFDLCRLMNVLMLLASISTRNKDDVLSVEGKDGRVNENSYPEVAHSLLLFVERLVLYMRNARIKFESSPGFEKIKSEHKRSRLSDDHEVEVKYSGPSGFGQKGEAVGCLPLLEELQATNSQCEVLARQAEALESHLSRKEKDSESEYDATLMDVVDLVNKFALAAKFPEHFYLALNMKPNGNMDYATGMDKDEYETLMEQQKWRKKPRGLPYAYPKTEQHPNVSVAACRHEPCRTTNEKGYFVGGRRAVYHGNFCDGTLPKWECHLVLRLLYPGLMLDNLRKKCHSVILASGSLSPIPSLCSELGLYPPKENASKPLNDSLNAAKQSQNSRDQSPSVAKDSKSKSETISRHGRLQIRPKPLEANHVVNLPKQLFAISVGHFPDGSPLTVNYNNYKNPSFFPRLGEAIASVVESTPRGGVLVFLPSYSFLNKCVKCWNPTALNRYAAPEIWGRLRSSKGKVIVEPTGSQEKFEEAKAEYREEIKQSGNCTLLAVFRGKMSEGISFNDDNARCVICVGLPFPSFVDRSVKAKRFYNDEQRRINKITSLLPGEEWYSQQAHRALAQALGRCIRHGADYGAVVMMDSRHCDDGAPNNGVCRAHKNLPKWMRHHMRTLSMHPSRGFGKNPVVGGYQGLRRDLSRLFQEAPTQAEAVRKKWKLDLETAKQRSSQSTQQETFNGQTGNWSSTPSKKELE